MNKEMIMVKLEHYLFSVITCSCESSIDREDWKDIDDLMDAIRENLK